MKVVQINVVYRHSSTGRTTMEMHQDQLSKGIESYVFTSMNPEKEHNVYPIGGGYQNCQGELYETFPDKGYG